MIILPFMLGWMRELFMATDSLFILSLLPPVGSQSISRDLERERETEDKSSEKRKRGRERESTRTECEDLFVLPVCGHTQGDKCLWEGSGISSVIMEHDNWFRNDFHFCTILTGCILVGSNLSLWWYLQLIAIWKQGNENLTVIGKRYFSFCFQNAVHCCVAACTMQH